MPEDELTEVEIALMDAIKTVIEAVILLQPETAAAFAESFKKQASGRLRTGQPRAAVVFELLRGFAADPARQTGRSRLAKLLAETPKGRA